MMKNTLSGRRVLVTGGLGMLGQAVVKALADAGASVAVVDAAPAGHTPAGAATVLAGVDLGNAPAAKTAIDSAVASLGGLDGLVNVAGGFCWEPVVTGNIDSWDRMYGMNLRSAVLTCQLAAPHLVSAGAGSAIVNVGAAAAAKAAMGMGAYTASKAGVAKLTEALAEELKDAGVRVNAVLPSILDTPTNRKDMPDADATRWVKPESLASVIAFLLSAQAADITGACLPVTGRV